MGRLSQRWIWGPSTTSASVGTGPATKSLSATAESTIPQSHSASSRAAAILGPLVWALTVDTLEASFGTAIAYRAAVMTVALMFVVAALILRGVPDRSRDARAVAA